MNTKPTVDEALDLLRDMRYSGQVDVTEAVMQQIEKQPLLVTHTPSHWRRWTAAACGAALLAAGTLTFRQFHSTDSNTSDLFCNLYESDNYGTNHTPICNEMAMANYIFE